MPLPWWAWVLIAIAAIAILLPIKIKIGKMIFKSKKPQDEESKEDF